VLWGQPKEHCGRVSSQVKLTQQRKLLVNQLAELYFHKLRILISHSLRAFSALTVELIVRI
jgi:hypothetical protein